MARAIAGTVTVQVQYVNAPAAGKKMGSIKCTDGVFYSVAPAMLNQFQVGQAYTIDYSENPYNGKTYYTVERFAVGGGATQSAAPPQPAPAPQPRPGGGVIESGNRAPVPIPAPRTAPQPHREDPRKARSIGILALVKPWVERIPVGDTAALIHALQSAADGYDKSGVFTGQQPDADLNDQIPNW